MTSVRGAAVLVISVLAILSTPVHGEEVQWRTDYTAALREASEKNFPLFVEFGTESCSWCKRLDASTLRDPAVISVLNGQFIPLKINVAGERWLIEALSIHSYPTLIFAAPDGTILEKQVGFVEAGQMTQQLRRTLASVAEGVASAQ